MPQPTQLLIELAVDHARLQADPIGTDAHDAAHVAGEIDDQAGA
ncbi:MAG: hypothetical protein U0836_07085 [Pirellulales bacterium]